MLVRFRPRAPSAFAKFCLWQNLSFDETLPNRSVRSGCRVEVSICDQRRASYQMFMINLLFRVPIMKKWISVLSCFILCLLINLSSDEANGSDQKTPPESSRDGSAKKEEPSPEANSSNSLFSPERLNYATDCYAALQKKYKPAKSALQKLERKVHAKQALDRKDYSAARTSFNEIILDDPQDFMTWFLLSKSLLGYAQSHNKDYEQSSLEYALMITMSLATSDIDRAAVLWLASQTVLNSSKLKEDALKLATAIKIEARIQEIIKIYPPEFGPYVLDIPQQAEAGSACLTWTQPLLRAGGFNYEDYVTLSPAVKDLAVVPQGKNLCIEGLSFGANYKLTLKKGLLGRNDFKLKEDYSFEFFIPHRKPSIQIRERE